jgi:hypothetical protein
VRHLKDLSSLEVERASSDLKSVTLILKILLHRHADSSKFVAGMTKMLERLKLSKGASLRRLELDIMHVGKVSHGSSYFHNEGVCVLTYVDIDLPTC